MAKAALRYSAILIGMYLVGSLATGYGRLLQPGANAGKTVIRAFQGKN